MFFGNTAAENNATNVVDIGECLTLDATSGARGAGATRLCQLMSQDHRRRILQRPGNRFDAGCSRVTGLVTQSQNAAIRDDAGHRGSVNYY